MRTPLLVLLGSAAYATARYNIFKGVPWTDWPVYTLNKAFALSALVLLVLSVVPEVSAGRDWRSRMLRTATVFGSVHVLLSLTLLSPVYYEKFFVQHKLTAAAGVSMLLGAVAAALMAGGKGSVAILALVVGLHAALQAFAGWFAPSEWPGLMPPITLISLLLGLAPLAIAWRRSWLHAPLRR